MEQQYIVDYRPKAGGRRVQTKPMLREQAERICFCLNLQGYPAEVKPVAVALGVGA